MDQEFKPGIYKHYKGHLYVALMLATHHESNVKFVVYVSLVHGTINLREWDTPGADSWVDLVNIPDGEGGFQVPRFAYQGPVA